MDRLIVDTGVLIALERGTIPTPGREDDLAIAAITASELLVGVLLADDGRRSTRAHAVEAILATFEVLDFDLAASRHHARLSAETRRTGRPRGANDLLIAATASATGRTVVTTDQRGFGELPGVAVRVLTST